MKLDAKRQKVELGKLLRPANTSGQPSCRNPDKPATESHMNRRTV
jgi:hypothetical protein